MQQNLGIAAWTIKVYEWRKDGMTGDIPAMPIFTHQRLQLKVKGEYRHDDFQGVSIVDMSTQLARNDPWTAVVGYVCSGVNMQLIYDQTAMGNCITHYAAAFVAKILDLVTTETEKRDAATFFKWIVILVQCLVKYVNFKFFIPLFTIIYYYLIMVLTFLNIYIYNIFSLY